MIEYKCGLRKKADRMYYLTAGVNPGLIKKESTRYIMMKKLICLLAVISLLFSLSSCISDKNEHETQEATTEETTTAEAVSEEITTKQAEETVNIIFREDRAQEIYTFDSEIYGKLTVFLQDGYFLIFDEFGGKRFTVFAEGYTAEKTDNISEGISTDMNFDGYSDFGVCYYKDELNSYYYCFLWDNEVRTFRYCLALSNLANPSFNKTAQTVISDNRQTHSLIRQETYYFLRDELRYLSSKEITKEPSETAALGAESVDAGLNIMENGNSALISLNINPYSSSSWKCLIDDESIIYLSSENLLEAENKTEFLLTALAPGKATVAFRYVHPETDTYVEEIILSITVDENKNVTAKEI